jgi:hypothetical protein
MKYVRWWLVKFGGFNAHAKTVDTCELIRCVVKALMWSALTAVVILFILVAVYVVVITVLTAPAWAVCWYLNITPPLGIGYDYVGVSTLFYVCGLVVFLCYQALTEFLPWVRRITPKRSIDTPLQKLWSDVIYSIAHKVCVKVDVSSWNKD